MKLTKELESKIITRTGPNKSGDRSMIGSKVEVLKVTEKMMYYVCYIIGNVSTISLEEWDDGKWEDWKGEKLNRDSLTIEDLEVGKKYKYKNVIISINKRGEPFYVPTGTSFYINKGDRFKEIKTVKKEVIRYVNIYKSNCVEHVGAMNEEAAGMSAKHGGFTVKECVKVVGYYEVEE